MSAQTTQTNQSNAAKQREERIMATTLSPVKGGAKGAPAEAGGATPPSRRRARRS